MAANTSQTRIVAAAISCGVAAMAPYTVMPLAIGGLIKDFHLTASQGGYIAAAEMAGSGLASLIISWFIARLNWRHTIGAALVMFALVNVGAAVTSNVWSMGLLRFAAGLSAGTVAGTIGGILASTSSPARGFSVFVLSNRVLGVIIFAATPPLILKHWGVSGLYILFAVMALLPLAFLRYLPGTPLPSHQAEGKPPSSFTLPATLAMIGVFAAFVAFGGLWPFLEQIGGLRGLTATQTGFVLSGAQAGGICAALLAGALTAKYAHRKLITIGILSTMAMTIVFILNGTQLGYIISVITFNSAFVFIIPYLSGMPASLDRTGRLVVIGITMQTAGMAIGPAGAGLILAQSSYAVLFAIAAMMLGLALILILSATRKSHTITTATAE